MDTFNRLECFEKMLSDIQSQYEDKTKRMAELKSAGKEKTATYRQLMGNKLQYQNMLSLYKIYGLLDEESK